MSQLSNMRNLYKTSCVFIKTYSKIRIANYKSAEIVDIDGKFYMHMYKATSILLKG